VSETHHVFVHVEDADLDATFARFVEVGFTLNPRRKPLFRSSGLRFGTQEIARSQWQVEDVATVAVLIADVLKGAGSLMSLQGRVLDLARRNALDPDLYLPVDASR
jgi:glycine/serine hydroxymethyltransferase